MTTDRDPETILAAWLDEGPTDLPDVTRRAILTALPTTNQAWRSPIAPWRFPFMNALTRYAGLALVALLAISGAIYLIGLHPAAGGPGASPIPTTVPTVAPAATAAAVDTTNWTKYTSANYGFSVGLPPTWFPQPAVGHWAFAKQDDAAIETLWSQSGWPEFQGFETKIPAGMTADTLITALTADGVSTACLPAPSQWDKITIDGHPATMANGGCNQHFYFADAFAVIGDRVWMFILTGPDRSLIVPFLSTVKIDVASVVD